MPKYVIGHNLLEKVALPQYLIELVRRLPVRLTVERTETHYSVRLTVGGMRLPSPVSRCCAIQVLRYPGAQGEARA